jgi:hypothetical protein
MRAVPVVDKSSVEIFHSVPKGIYKDDPNYIPHVKQDIEKIFDPSKNKLFKDGKAERWVFYNEEGKLVGRVAAFINPKTAHTEDQPTGGIGFFECINDQESANFIFDHSKKWLEENGMEAMDGPVNFGERNQFWGCLTKNFTDPNSYAMNYNPPYYPELFENYGFQTYFEQYLYKRPVQLPVQEIFIRKLERLMKIQEVTCGNIEGVPLDKVARDFLEVYNGAWGGHDNFKPMKLEAAQKIVKSLKPILDRRIVIFAYHKERPIAFFVNIPELNEIFKYIDGDLNWIGKLKFLYHKWKGTPRTMVGIVFGVVKEWHGKGVEGAMIHWSGEYLKKKPIYDEIVMQWIGDFNPKMLKVCENLGATRYREMKTYRYLFDRNKPFQRCPVIES